MYAISIRDKKALREKTTSDVHSITLKKTKRRKRKKATGISSNKRPALQNCFGVLQNYHMRGYLLLYKISVCFHESSVHACDGTK